MLVFDETIYRLCEFGLLRWTDNSIVQKLAMELPIENSSGDSMDFHYCKYNSHYYKFKEKEREY